MPRLYKDEIKQKALSLRKNGYSYSEIQQMIKYPVPKSTMTEWFRQIILTESAKMRIVEKIRISGIKGLSIARGNDQKRRLDRISKVYKKANDEFKMIDQLTAKLCLAMLYLGEGGKTNEWIRLGNSDHKVIEIFLSLLRNTYNINENKLRGKVQCRADQDIIELEKFWSKISKIPLNQFQKAQVDNRTIGIPTRKPNYKGVFVVEYYSHALFLELKFFSDIMHQRLLKGHDI